MIKRDFLYYNTRSVADQLHFSADGTSPTNKVYPSPGARMFVCDGEYWHECYMGN